MGEGTPVPPWALTGWVPLGKSFNVSTFRFFISRAENMPKLSNRVFAGVTWANLCDVLSTVPGSLSKLVYH